MTPERAEYHRLMLLVGFKEEYERELDEILEKVDPIISPELELACCMSDLEETISVLYNYVITSGVDEQKVFDMVMTELRRRYSEHTVTTKEMVDILDRIALHSDSDSNSSWEQLRYLAYQYELVEDDLLSEEVFNTAFEARFLRGEYLDIDKMEMEYRLKKARSRNEIRRQKQKKLVIGILLATLLLCIANYITLPDHIMTGFGFQNGEQVIFYGNKCKIIFESFGGSVTGSVLWILFTKHSRKRLEEDPTLLSHKIKNVLAYTIGFFLTVSGLLVNLICLMLN